MGGLVLENLRGQAGVYECHVDVCSQVLVGRLSSSLRKLMYVRSIPGKLAVTCGLSSWPAVRGSLLIRLHLTSVLSVKPALQTQAHHFPSSKRAVSLSQPLSDDCVAILVLLACSDNAPPLLATIYTNHPPRLEARSLLYTIAHHPCCYMVFS